MFVVCLGVIVNWGDEFFVERIGESWMLELGCGYMICLY